MEQRTQIITYFDEKDKKMVEEACKIQGLGFSAFLRNAAILKARTDLSQLKEVQQS